MTAQDRVAAWFEASNDKTTDMGNIVRANFPTLIEQARTGDAPIKRIECPKGHMIGRIRLFDALSDADGAIGGLGLELLDRDGDRVSEKTSDRYTGIKSATARINRDTIGNGRTATFPLLAVATCRSCTYTGSPTLSTVLKEYVKAVVRDWPAVRLTD